VRKILLFAVISVLIVSVSVASISAQSQLDIPAWVKGVASFWVDGGISDSEFGESISFLIEQDIIRVEMSDDGEWKAEADKLYKENKKLETENKKLKQENAELKTKLGIIETGISSYLDDLESTIYECPSSHPYEWSDGSCYDQPEYYDNGCPNGYPYIWSDGQCHTIPEYVYDEPEYLDNGCPVGYPYIWSDGQCYTIPEYVYDEPIDSTPSCDPSYPDVCIPPYPPDLDCDEIFYSNFRVVGNDPHGFDADYDGIGCEVGSPQSPNPVESAPSCDPSYPDVCIPPYPPDLDCGEIGYSNFRVVGNDPHGFDGDKDGIGCES